jgi:hypothetical protein
MIQLYFTALRYAIRRSVYPAAILVIFTVLLRAGGDREHAMGVVAHLGFLALFLFLGNRFLARNDSWIRGLPYSRAQLSMIFAGVYFSLVMLAIAFSSLNFTVAELAGPDPFMVRRSENWNLEGLHSPEAIAALAVAASFFLWALWFTPGRLVNRHKFFSVNNLPAFGALFGLLSILSLQSTDRALGVGVVSVFLVLWIFSCAVSQNTHFWRLNSDSARRWWIIPPLAVALFLAISMFLAPSGQEVARMRFWGTSTLHSRENLLKLVRSNLDQKDFEFVVGRFKNRFGDASLSFEDYIAGKTREQSLMAAMHEWPGGITWTELAALSSALSGAKPKDPTSPFTLDKRIEAVEHSAVAHLLPPEGSEQERALATGDELTWVAFMEDHQRVVTAEYVAKLSKHLYALPIGETRRLAEGFVRLYIGKSDAFLQPNSARCERLLRIFPDDKAAIRAHLAELNLCFSERRAGNRLVNEPYHFTFLEPLDELKLSNALKFVLSGPSAIGYTPFFGPDPQVRKSPEKPPEPNFVKDYLLGPEIALTWTVLPFVGASGLLSGASWWLKN